MAELLDQAQPAALDSGRKSYLLYGPGGTGKTTFGLEHPAKRKLWIDLDDKLHEMDNIRSALFEGVKVWRLNELLGSHEIQVVSVDKTRTDPSKGVLISEKPKGFQKVVDLTNELMGIGYKIKKGELPPDAFPFDLIALDSLGRLSNHLEYAIMYEHKVSIITETLYSVFKRNMLEWLLGFLSLPCTRMVITHERHMEKRDKATGSIIIQKNTPLVTGSLTNELIGYFSEAYYFLGRQPDSKWYIQTAPDRITGARTTKKLDFEQVIDPKLIYG